MTNQRDKGTRQPTRNDVARLAGVSSAVVSYVVNDGPRPVAAATRERVLAAIEKLSYRPNSAARSLITGRTDLLGLIVPDVENAYFAGLAKAVETEATRRGMKLVLTQCFTPDLPEMVESLASHQVDGIITATLPPAGMIIRGRGPQVPMVKLSLAMPIDPVPALWPDFYGGTKSAVSHLVESHSHTRVGLVTGADSLDVRENGWRDALTQRGLEPGPIIRIPWSSDGGVDAAQRLVDAGLPVTAVFVASDQQALGLLAGFHRLGIRAPTDVAVASFDGSRSSAYAIPSLTTVGVPFADMARDAIDELMGKRAVNRSYPTTLIVRESCGCAPAGSADAADSPGPP